MRTLVALVLGFVVVGAGLKMAGARLQLIDYPLSPIGVDGPGPGMPEVQIEPPGFGDFEAP